jgi:hypothetical protein
MRGAAFEERRMRTIRATSAGALAFGSALLLSSLALAQEPAPPTAGYPPTEGPPPSSSPPPPPAVAPAPAPAYGDPPPVEYARPPEGRRDPRPPARDSDIDEPPPPPPPLPPQEQHGFKMPPWSVRIDPFTWVLEGKLGIELEVGVLKWLSVELVPVFLTGTKPPTFSSYASRDSDVSQHSNGLGPLSGASIGAGFWFQGNVLHGYVLRAIFTDYGYTYTSNYPDQFTHTDRWFMGMFGAHNTFGPFTIAGGIGLGVELNQAEYCGAAAPGDSVKPSGCNDLRIRLRDGSTGSVAPSFYPVVLAGRFSFGVTFD